MNYLLITSRCTDNDNGSLNTHWGTHRETGLLEIIGEVIASVHLCAAIFAFTTSHN